MIAKPRAEIRSQPDVLQLIRIADLATIRPARYSTAIVIEPSLSRSTKPGSPLTVAGRAATAAIQLLPEAAWSGLEDRTLPDCFPNRRRSRP